MGIGGHLTWEAVARILHQRYGYKLLPLDGKRKVNSPAFENSPYIAESMVEGGVIMAELNRPESNYCIEDHPEYAVHRNDKHIISVILEGLNAEDAKESELYCEMHWGEGELDLKPEDYGLKGPWEKVIAIEPDSKTNYTHNRAYPIKHWAKVVEGLRSRGYEVVRVGKGVGQIDGFESQTKSFREAAAVATLCGAFITTESGLAHATSNVGNTVVIIGSYNDPKMVAYPKNHNILIGKHAPCGKKVLCEICKEEFDSLEPATVIEAATRLIK